MKIFDIFLTFAQNIDCEYTLKPPRGGGSNEYPQSMFWSKNKYTPAYPMQFYYIRVGFKGVFISRACFPDVHYEKHVFESQHFPDLEIHVRFMDIYTGFPFVTDIDISLQKYLT